MKCFNTISNAKSIFRWNSDKLISFTTEKREVSSAKSFAVEERFITEVICMAHLYILRKGGALKWILEALHPAVTGSHLDDWPFKTTLWNLWMKFFWIIYSGRPVTSICFSLKR